VRGLVGKGMEDESRGGLTVLKVVRLMFS